MTQRLFLTAVLVRDYDEAIAFYVEKPGFEVRIDTPLSRPRGYEPYRTVAVFEDLSGNRWDLIQHTGKFGIEPDSIDRS